MILSKILELTDNKSLSAIGIPVLGTQFGCIKLEEFISIFVETLNQHNFEHALKIWLIVKSDECQKAYEVLKPFECNLTPGDH